MALVINVKDLEGLFGQPASMDLLLEVISETLRAHVGGKITAQGGFSLPLVDGKRSFRLLTAALPNAGVVLRTYPLFTGARDAHFNLLFDGQTGELLALISGAELNVWRTGAPAGIACRLLAPPEAKVLALLGSGRQAKGQLLAIRRATPSLEKVRVFSSNKDHRTNFARQMSSWLQIEIEPVDGPRTAIEDADIVDLATNARAPVCESTWIAPGALVISIGSGQLPPDLVSQSRVFISSREELLNFKPAREPYSAMMAAGIWSADQTIELGELILGRQQGRRSESDIVVFELLGMPAWDAAASAWAYHWAREHKAGTFFSLA